MRNQTKQEQDQYIHNLARQVIAQIGVTEDEFEACGDSRTFAECISDRVWGWVRKNLTNTGTLAKVIECAVDRYQCSVDERPGRCTALIDVCRSITEDRTGLDWLRDMAAYTISAAIRDFFLEKLGYAPGGEDNFFIGQDQYNASRQ